MPHGESWLSYFPGYKALEHWLVSTFGHSWGFQGPIVAQHIAAMILVALLVIILSLTARRQLAASGDDILPDGRFSARSIVELVMKFVLYLMQFAMPYKTALKHFPVVGTFGFFILFANLLGLLPGFVPPTDNFNTTFACGSIIFLYYNGYALYRLGLGHIAHMANPVGEPWGWFMAPLFLPLELVSHCVRPFSLAIRLYCNIAGDHLVLLVFVGFTPWLLPLPFLGLGLFVAVLQTLIFVTLSSVYIGEVEAMIAHHEASHGHEGAHEHATREHESQPPSPGAQVAAH